MAGDHVTHRIDTAREYYVAQVGRCLEVRARDTHAVLQVLKPPPEWGNDWLWSSCGFDGLRCVAGHEIRFLRANQKRAVADISAPRDEQEEREPNQDDSDAGTGDELGSLILPGCAASSEGSKLSPGNIARSPGGDDSAYQTHFRLAECGAIQPLG